MKMNMNWAQRLTYSGLVSTILLFCVSAAKPLADNTVKAIGGISEPGTILLLGLGLIGLGWLVKHKTIR